jgi:EcsC family protein
MTDTPDLATDDGHVLLHAPTTATLEELRARLRASETLGVKLLAAIGGQADGLLDRLPRSTRDVLEQATARALMLSYDLAFQSRKHGLGAGAPEWVHTALTTGMGMAGGLGGLGTALAELPVTTTLLLRNVQDVAGRYGFDPQEKHTRLACLHVLAATGPLCDRPLDQAGFLAARMTLSGATVQGVIAKVAPRLSVVLGKKLATQAVPVLGAAAGAATNFTYARYYRNVAHVSFGLRRLAQDSDSDYDTLLKQIQDTSS